MRTYADYLAALTVKTLNTVARDMGLKGYSKLRKAELIVMIDDAIAATVPVILVEGTDDSLIVALMAEIASEVAATPIEFSDASATPAPSPIVAQEATETVSLDELKYAYRAMRKTLNNMYGGPARVRMVGRLRKISNELKGMGVMPQYL